MKKLLCFAIALFAAIMPALYACGDPAAQNPVNPDEPDSPETSEQETTAYDSLPDDLDFGGATINIFHFGSQDTKDYDAGGEMGGDIVLDAVYQRNRKTEERLNVKLNWIAGSDEWDTFPNQVNTALLAGTGDYDLIMEENSRAFQHSLRGYFYDLMDASYIDLEAPWWYVRLMEEGSIDNNKRYFITGDLTVTTLLGASAVYFNKALYVSYFEDLGTIYDHVLNGTWTHDVFAEYCKGVYSDLNGNQIADEGDRFGFEYEEWGIPNYLSMSTGLTFSARDPSGLPLIDVYNEYGVMWGETLYKLLHTDNISLKSTTDKRKAGFLDETNLFYVGCFFDAPTFRNSSFEYGMLPYPKLSENLEYMSGAATVNGNGVAIPAITPPEKFEAVCAAVESLCSEAAKSVVPTWYETALKIKYLNAEIDAQMVDLIYDHITAPFIMMADKELGIGSIFTYALFNAKESGAFASYYEKNEGSMNSKWDKMIERYLELEE
ncbi:MAG: hypothetical protein FWH48_05070 [Oscillospiraceae bacterium]|nr:hypothetical protein [Oscillospiraceae bacterium]